MIKFRVIIKQKKNTGWCAYYRSEEPRVSYWRSTNTFTSYLEAEQTVKRLMDMIQLSQSMYENMFKQSVDIEYPRHDYCT